MRYVVLALRCGAGVWARAAVVLLIIAGVGCKKGAAVVNDRADSTVVPTFDINSIGDTYADVSAFTYYPKWGPYNVHDPSIRKIGDYYYCYSTDVGYGITVPAGIQVRRSKDLVQWQFVGWVFNGVPAVAASYISSNGGTANTGLWAPYVLTVGGEVRLYYSLSSSSCKLSTIGLAASGSPEGPWVSRGLVVSSTCAAVMTNAIDPTVVVTPGGQHWLYYGSAYDGIYVVQLDPATGLVLHPGDVGKRIANRGFTGGKYNGNIEGAEVIWNPQLRKYFLFVSYDWLETKYNVRVARGDNPDGPFYDFNGVDVNTDVDHGPMIIVPYQFSGHGGWQGTAHCTVFDDGAGHYFIAHQGRPGVDKYFMDLHVRKIFWTGDGWPVASPERYAWEGDSVLASAVLVGDWEVITLGYRVVVGYQAEQVSPDFQVSGVLSLRADGSFDGGAGAGALGTGTYSYAAPWLTLNYSSGRVDKVIVQPGRDWENKKNTIIFSGLNNSGIAVWGKKK